MAPIFLVVGGPASGKSTTSRALATTFDRSVHIPVDDLRHMVVSGLALPAADWGPDLVAQVRLGREAGIAMAVAYADAGFAVVMDDFWDPNGLREYGEVLARPDARGVVLHPSLEETRRRLHVRAGAAGDPYIEAALPFARGVLDQVVDRLPSEGWLVLDTTHMDVAQVVEAILEPRGR